MVVNEKMNNSEKIITGIVSKKEFDSNLSSVSKIAEVSKMGGKSVLFRKEGNKLIMCAGGIKTSVAMVAIDIESDNRDECKGFIDGSALVKQFAGLKAAKEDKLEISFNLSKSCIGVRNSKGKTVVAFDVIKHVESAKNAEDTIAKYRNEMVERTYRLVRDVQTLGKVQLRCKDFLEIEKSFTCSTYEVQNEKCIHFRVFKEVQKIKKKIKESDSNKEKIVFVDQEFPIIEGIGFNEGRISTCRKYGIGIGLPQGQGEMSMLIDYDILKHVSAAITVMQEEDVLVSKGVDGVCIWVGQTRFIFPAKNIQVEDVSRYLKVPYLWKIVLDAEELTKSVGTLTTCLDRKEKTYRIPPINNTVVLPEDKKIFFNGIDVDGYPVELYVDYKMAVDGNGLEYRDFDGGQVNLKLHRKYIKDFLKCCKSKKISIGVHVYEGKTKTGEICKGKFVSIEDANQGVYGVHHRIAL